MSETVKTEYIIEELYERFSNNRHLEAIMKWGHIMLCASNADHYLNKMETLRYKATMDNILEIDGLILVFVVTYARMLTDAANGFPKLERNKVYNDEALRGTHDRIMSLRNTRYAHEGGSEDIDYYMNLSLKGDVLAIKPEIRFGIPGNEFPAFRNLINVLQNYVYEKIHRTIERGSKELGLKIEFPHGPPPAHRL